MSLNDLNEAVASSGGNWVKLLSRADGALEGTVVSFEKRNRTDPEGNVVMKKGTTNPRLVWTFAVKVDDSDRDGPDDDGLRKFDANESAQRAIADAIKAAGKPASEGDRLKIAVKVDRETEYSQPVYQAKWTPGAKPLDVPDADDDDEDF